MRGMPKYWSILILLLTFTKLDSQNSNTILFQKSSQKIYAKCGEFYVFIQQKEQVLETVKLNKPLDLDSLKKIGYKSLKTKGITDSVKVSCMLLSLDNIEGVGVEPFNEIEVKVTITHKAKSDTYILKSFPTYLTANDIFVKIKTAQKKPKYSCIWALVVDLLN